MDFTEFLLAYIATTAGTNREKFEYAFEVFDINENNQIEKREAEKILTLIGRVTGMSEFDAKMYSETVMLSFDANGDKVLSKDEFINGCIHDSTLGRIANPFNY